MNIGDQIIYCPFYASYYSKEYEGIIIKFSKNKNYALCKLGFGKKWCMVCEIVKKEKLIIK